MTSAEARTGWRPGVIYAFDDGVSQARVLAARCGADFHLVDRHTFPDRETRVTVASHRRAQGRVVALYRSLHDPNAKLVEVLLAASVLRAAGPEKLILVAPYLPYMRQDRAFNPGEAISQQVIGSLLGAAFDGVLAIEPHLHRTRALTAAVHTNALALSIEPAVVAELRGTARPGTIVIGPDEESADLINAIGSAAGLESFTGKKVRLSDTDVRIDLPMSAKVANQPIAIVDDIVSSGGTLANLARTLRAQGAGPITAYIAHALFDEASARNLAAAGIAQIKSLDSVPHPTNAMSVIDVIASGMGITA